MKYWKIKIKPRKNHLDAVDNLDNKIAIKIFNY